MIKSFLCLLLLGFSSTALSQWMRTSGPPGGSIAALYSTNGTAYCGTYSNGVFASTDDGVTWSPRNSGIENYRVLAITGAAGNLFAGTEANGTFHSTDDGETWLPPSNGTGFYVTSLITKDNYVFAGTILNGVQRSSDNGVTWETVLPNDFIYGLGVAGSRLFASENAHTYVSVDDGNTWNNVPSLEARAPYNFYTSGNLVIAGGTNEVYRSTDRGINFTTIPVSFTFSVVNLYYITAIGSTLYMSTSYDGVYESTDQGLSWFPANNGMGAKDLLSITVTGTSTLLAGGHYAGLFRSTDAGASWVKSMTGISSGATIGAFFAADSFLLAGTRDGIYRTTDNGLSWNKLTGNDTVDYGQVRGICQTNQTIYAGMFYQFYSTVYKSTNNGASWERSGNGLPPSTTFINGMGIIGENVVAGTDNGLFYSTDQGDSWHPAAAPTNSVGSITTGGGYIYALEDFVGIFRSVDGISWSQVAIVTGKVVKISAYNNYLYAGTAFSGAFYSPDYGLDFYPCQGFPNGSSVFGIGAAGMGIILAGTDTYPTSVYASFDNGISFAPYSEGWGQNVSAEYFAASDSFMFAATDYNGIWRRLLPGITPVELSLFKAEADNGNVTLSWTTATEKNNRGFEVERKSGEGKEQSAGQKGEWEEIGFIEGNGTTTQPNSYSYVDKNLPSGKYSYRLKQMDFDGSLEYSDLVEVSVQSPLVFALEQNYPNPFNPATRIRYQVPVRGLVSLKVYDILGNEAAVLVNEQQVPGSYSVNFNASRLASGVYIYQLRLNGFVSSKKMLLLK